MQIEFRDTYSRWHHPSDPVTADGRAPDELHVEPKQTYVRELLWKALVTGEVVVPVGTYNATKYSVLREVDGTFVLVNSRGNVL